MSLRYGKIKNYFLQYSLKTRENKAKLMNFFKLFRQEILKQESKKLKRRIQLWSVACLGGYFVYNYFNQKMRIRKLERKLQTFYGNIMTQESLNEKTCKILHPGYIDELANILNLVYKYNYKVVVEAREPSPQEKQNILKENDNKCLFINLSNFNKGKIDSLNKRLEVEIGATCKQINQLLVQNGFKQIFPKQIENQNLFSAVVNNLPTEEGELSKIIVNMELVSAEGVKFRSASETNRYGQVASLNNLFIGAGELFAVPVKVTIKIAKLENGLKEENYKINIQNASERINLIRKLSQQNRELLDIVVKGSNEELIYSCRERIQLPKKINLCLEHIENNPTFSASMNNIKQSVKENSNQKDYNLYFDVNETMFESYYIKYGQKHSFELRNNLLKIHIPPQDQIETYQVINQITNNNGILVWCKDRELLLSIKPSLSSSEIGAGLMKKIEQVREGFDHKKIFYSRLGYENYFRKSFFRRSTEMFW